MRLIYVSRFQFKIVNNQIYSLPAYGNGFWEKYLDVFDSIHVIGEPVKDYLDNGTMVLLTDSRISVDIVPSIERPNELKKTIKVKKILEKIIKQEQTSAFLIKPSSRKGMLAIKYCECFDKPYMIEMTGDVKTTLDERNSRIMSIYGLYLYKKILRSIQNCEFGLYVTEKYLQKRYPIKGKMCGCTDSVIPAIDERVLMNRLDKINSEVNEYSIGLIGYYHDTRKGIDTAIDALKIVNHSKKIISLSILGIGTDEDRKKWCSYAKEREVDDALHFPKPLKGSYEVVKWIDTMDIIILPSRSEGFPRAIAEAMSRACPTITSNVCGLEEMVETKWQHEAGDSVALASLIQKMINDTNQMIQAAKYNFEKSKRYEFNYLRDKRNMFLSEFKAYSEDCYKKKKQQRMSRKEKQ